MLNFHKKTSILSTSDLSNEGKSCIIALHVHIITVFFLVVNQPGWIMLMKKLSIWILLTVTLVFVAFVGGIYFGRNCHFSQVQISGNDPASAHTSASPSRPTNLSPSAPVPSSSILKPSGSSSVPAVSTMPTVVTAAPVFPININTATAEELDLLPEIGPVLAQRIVAYRKAFGDFESVEDLLRVNGIGQKTLDKIRDYITV